MIATAATCLLTGLHGLLLLLGAAAAALLLGLGASALLAARPDSAAWLARAPYPAFWLGSWCHWAAERIGRLKPAPIRVAEVATSYVQSQVRRWMHGQPACMHGQPACMHALHAACMNSPHACIVGRMHGLPA